MFTICYSGASCCSCAWLTFTFGSAAVRAAAQGIDKHTESFWLVVGSVSQACMEDPSTDPEKRELGKYKEIAQKVDGVRLEG